MVFPIFIAIGAFFVFLLGLFGFSYIINFFPLVGLGVLGLFSLVVGGIMIFSGMSLPFYRNDQTGFSITLEGVFGVFGLFMVMLGLFGTTAINFWNSLWAGLAISAGYNPVVATASVNNLLSLPTISAILVAVFLAFVLFNEKKGISKILKKKKPKKKKKKKGKK